MAYNKSTTVGQIQTLSSNILGANDVFKIGKRKLARIFLRALLGLNINDNELETAYKACSPRSNIPTDSEEFWSFVEREYLHLAVEPMEKFAELSFHVNEDLIALAENLSYIKNELEGLETQRKNEGR